MSEYRKPLPRPSVISQPFWDAAKEGRLVVQACGDCGGVQFPPKPLCANCWSRALEWRTCSGRGAVYTYTVAHRTSTRGFREDTPYAVAIVELAEGPRMTSNIVGCLPEDVRIGMPVEAVFDPVTPETTLIKFRPAAAVADGRTSLG
jgi:uncharacterized OB-fold protein